MPKNVDVAFVGVEYAALPTKLRQMRLGDPSPDDYAKVDDALGKVVSRDQVFVIEGNDRRYIVVAAAMKVVENELDLFESSLEHF